MLLSGVLYAMGGNTPNYDERYDSEVASVVGEDVHAMRATKARTLSSLELKSYSFQEKLIVGRDGKKNKKNMPVKQVKRGSAVVYINRILNKSNETKTEIVVKNPIPEGTVYVKDSAICDKGCAISYSTDGGATLETSDDGKRYNYIEFHFSNIYPKKEVRMGFRAIVE
jgi:uncharacterized repeat protein (TIGR01451 family)